MADRFRALYPALAVEPTTAMPGAREAVDAVHRHGGRVVVVTAKYEPNARLHLDHLGIAADEVVGWRYGPAKGEALREHDATVYVGDHLADIEGARAADAVGGRGCDRTHHRRRAACRRCRCRARRPGGVPGVVRRSRTRPASRPPRRPTRRTGLAGGRVLGRRRLGVPARSRRAGTRTRPRPRRHRGLGQPAGHRAGGGTAVRGRPRRTAPHPRDRRAGAGRLPGECRRPLLLLQGRAARRGRPPRRRSGVRARRDRHERRRRRGGVPARHQGGRRAGRPDPAAGCRAHQGAGTSGEPPLGAGHLGQARGSVPVEPDRLRGGDHAGPAVPGGAGRDRLASGAGSRRHRRREPAGPRPR